jgi:peptidoglycan/LPS O-acetylase OafA/YrhL
MNHSVTMLGRGGALDGLRFAAAAFITVFHFGSEYAPRALAELHPVFGRGFLATDFFLMLSGYVLARMYGERIVAGRTGAAGFLVRRVARIWPAHLIVLAAYAVAVAAATLAGVAMNNPDGFAWELLPGHALLVHAWGLSRPGWNYATWTLSALVVCYAVFPLLWRGLVRLPSTAALPLAVAVVALADVAARAWAGQELFRLAPAIGLGRGLPLFLLGAAMARFGAGLSFTRRQAWAVGWVAAAAGVLSQAVPGFTFVTILAIATVILAAGALAPRRPSARVAQAAALAFALFLTHNLAGMVYFKALGLAGAGALAEPLRWALWAGVFPLCLLAALLFDRWVDRPVQDWVKGRLQPRPALRLKPGAAA